MTESKKQSQAQKWNHGSKVEVCSWEEGFQGAWFKAVILSRIRKHSWKVMYEDFDADNGDHLVEVVPYTQIRPLPPKRELPLTISVGDSVEAYDRWCWWRGVVIKLCNAESSSTSETLHWVYFPDTRTLKAYPRCELRLAQEWINGTWQCRLESANVVSAVEAILANALEMDSSLDYYILPCTDKRGGTPERETTTSQRNTSSAEEASESPSAKGMRQGKRRLTLEDVEDPTSRKKRSSSAEEASESPSAKGMRRGKRRLTLEDVEDPTSRKRRSMQDVEDPMSRKRRQIQDKFLSQTVRGFEVSAYQHVLKVFLKRGINSNRLDVLHKTAKALNISRLEQQEFYRALKAPSARP